MSTISLILGGPGCGKTTKLLSIINKLLKTYAPGEILFLGYTRRAAQEARERIQNKLVECRTIHSYCFRQLGIEPGTVMEPKHYREIGQRLGMDFSRVNIENGFMQGFNEDAKLQRVEQLARIQQMDLAAACRENNINIKKAYWYRNALDKYKADRGMLDYTDMITQFIERLPGSLRFPSVVIIDEGQDLSAIQWAAVTPLIQLSREAYIAGDDDQAIYTWAGADIRRFLNIHYDNKQNLRRSYRLPKDVFLLSEEIVNKIQYRYKKAIIPEDRSGRLAYINDVDDVLKNTTIDESWLLLCRNGYQQNYYIEACRRFGLPYTVKENSSLDNKDVSKICNYELLRSGYRVSAASAYDVLMGANKEFIDKGKVKKLKNLNHDNLIDMQTLAHDYGVKMTPPWYDFLDISQSKSRYYRAVIQRGNKEGKKLRSFLYEPPKIRISTIHGVKGAEASNVVIMPDLSPAEYDVFTNVETADNEHRVFYVAVTRAKNNLFILHPRGLYYYGF